MQTMTFSLRTAQPAISLLAVMMLCGCATAQRPDPLEPMNRRVYAFNEGVDRHVLQPVASGYRRLLPETARIGVTNFFSNLGDPWSAINLVLQGRIKEGLSDLGRFGTNTFVGVLGLFDVATGWGMPRHAEDFGQTLGSWGIGPGAYIVWPLLGPSDLRDSVGLPIDYLASPQSFIADASVRNSMTTLRTINLRANLLQTGQLLDEISLDKYVFVRDAYLQRRRSLVHDADPNFDSPAAHSGSADDDEVGTQ